MYSVWSEITENINSIRSAFWEQPETVQEGLSALVRSVYGPMYEKLGFEFKTSEPDNVHLLRNLVIGTAGKAGYQK